MAVRTTMPERAPPPPSRPRRRAASGGSPSSASAGLGAIDDVTLEFGSGLTVVTGETGAGKTMVVTGLTLLFGGRADPGRVRANGRAGVEGRLLLPADSAAWERAAEAGADPDEDGSLILSRTVSAEGRSRAYLGGRSVPVGVIAELAEGLLAVHGQTDQMRLSRPAEQRRALDRYAGAGAPRAARALPRGVPALARSWPPTWSAGTPRPASSPRPPTCSATAWPRSAPSSPSPARTRPWPPRSSGSATPTRCARPPTRPAWP